MSQFIRVRAVEPLADFHARVTFTNDEQRDINLWPYVNADGVFEPVRSDPAFFQQMRVEGNTITWPNGADIDPDVLYLGLPPDASEEAWRTAVHELETAQHQ